MKSAKRTVVPLAFAGGFFLLGLLTLDHYGVSWDEPMHREWGEIIWSYLVTGNEELLTDFPGAGQYYGPLFYILNYGVSHFAHEVLGLGFEASNHLLTVFAASLGVLCTFLLAESLTNRRAAIGATILLFLLPPFLAHAHYNPKDVPLLTLSTAALLFAARAYRSLRARDAILTGVFLGWAGAMKPTAVVLLPIIGGAIIADMVVRRRSADLRMLARLTAVAAVASMISLVLSWPTLWRRPSLLIDSVLYFARGGFWTGNVLYFGRLSAATELPWHYMPVMLLMALPLASLFLAVLGSVRALTNIVKREDVFPAALLLLWIVVPLLLFMKPGLARYDGMRQLFFVVPAIAILGGIGWDGLWAIAARSTGLKRIFTGFSSLLILSLLAECVRVFPYGGSYVNEPARVMLGPHLEQKFEIEYWGVTYLEGVRWLTTNAPRNSVLCVPIAPRIMAWHRKTTEGALKYDCDSDPDYLMLMTRFSEWPDEYQRYRSAQPIFTITRLGSDLLYVYDAR
jgi:hypothetical protein